MPAALPAGSAVAANRDRGSVPSSTLLSGSTTELEDEEDVDEVLPFLLTFFVFDSVTCGDSCGGQWQSPLSLPSKTLRRAFPGVAGSGGSGRQGQGRHDYEAVTEASSWGLFLLSTGPWASSSCSAWELRKRWNRSPHADWGGCTLPTATVAPPFWRICPGQSQCACHV